MTAGQLKLRNGAAVEVVDPARASTGRQEGRLDEPVRILHPPPVFATVLSLVLVLLGIVSYSRLTVREYPNVDEPVVSVSTSYPGASATIIESQVTQVLEGSIAGIEGIDVLESTSRAETSRITVRFQLRRRSRRGRQRRARPRQPRARPAARRGRRADHRQGRGRRPGRSSTSSSPATA